MYPKSRLQVSESTVPFFDGVDLKDRSVYRPFSYYVLGGIDVDGDNLLMSADIDFDPESDIESGCSVDGACDPRVSGFDIAEQVGIDAYNKVLEKAAKSKASTSESSTSESSTSESSASASDPE